MKTLNRYFIEQLFNELLFLQASIIAKHEMKLSLQMIENLSTIDILQNLFGQRDGWVQKFIGEEQGKYEH